MVPLLRSEGGEKESQFGLVSMEDGRPAEAETMVLPLTTNEAPVVDVARGLDSGRMIEQAHRFLMQAPYGVGYHREEGNVEGFVWACVLAVLRVVGRPAGRGRSGRGGYHEAMEEAEDGTEAAAAAAAAGMAAAEGMAGEGMAGEGVRWRWIWWCRRRARPFPYAVLSCRCCRHHSRTCWPETIPASKTSLLLLLLVVGYIR